MPGTAAVSPRTRPAWGAISGQIQTTDRQGQALISDVAEGATVALIDSLTGQTVATTVSSSTGAFTLTLPDVFTPLDGRPYLVEASKRLPVGIAANRAGAVLARLRTIVRFENGSWVGLVASPTSSGLDIGYATTALAVIASLRGFDSTQISALVGHLSDDVFDPAGTAVSAGEFSTVYGLVQQAVAGDQDPVAAIAYDSTQATPETQYALRPSDAIVATSVNPAKIAAGGAFTITGQNFPSPGSAKVMVGPQVMDNWSVNASRTRLTLAVPSGDHGGLLEIQEGGSQWFGPYLGVSGTVGTLAGSFVSGSIDSVGPYAELGSANALAFDATGSLYFSQGGSIRKISPMGIVTTVTAALGLADGMALDSAGNIYVTTYSLEQIMKVSPTGMVTTFAGSGANAEVDGTGTAAAFSDPQAITMDSGGNLYVADFGGNTIRKITPSGVVSTLISTGALTFPAGVVLDPTGAYLYYDTWATDYVYRLTLSNNSTTVLAGNGSNGFADGTGTAAQFFHPNQMAIDSAGNIYVGDGYNYRVRKITPGGVVSTIAGNGSSGLADGASTTAEFKDSDAVAVDDTGMVYVGDNGVREITP